MRLHPLLPTLLLLAASGAGPLAAQALAREDLPLIDVAQGDARTRTELTLGKDALARATTSGSWGTYQEAVRHFEEAALRSPGLAEPWFGLALSRLALFESGASALISPTQPLGAGNRAAWASHIRAVLERDPRHVGALTSIGHVLLPQGDRQQPAWLRDALARAESLGVVTPDLTLIHGRLARQQRRYDEAAASFRSYRAQGGDPAVAAIEEARALAGTGDLDAAAARYDSGLAVLTPEGLKLYRADLEVITEGDELASLQGIGVAEAAAWIRHFWTRRDALDVRPEGDRLREHLRRWIVANERYRVVDPDRRLLFHEPWAPILDDAKRPNCTPSDSFDLVQAGAHEARDSLDTRRAERILDDRGLMYLRHGDPLRVVWTAGAGERDHADTRAARERELQESGLPRDVIARTLASDEDKWMGMGSITAGTEAAEVWTYLIDGQVRSFLFIGSNFLGLHAPTTLTSYVGSADLALLRAQVDPRFYTIWNRAQNDRLMSLTCFPSVQRLAREVRGDLMLAGSTDDHPLLFPMAAIPAVQVAAMGHPAEGNGQIVVAYAIPGDRLAPARDSGRFVYPLAWRLTAVDSLGEIRRAEGSLLQSTSDSLVQGRFLSGTLTLPVPPGVWQVGVALFQPDERRGGAIEARRVELDSTPVAMSDLLLGRPDDLVRWHDIPINPLGTWRRHDAMTIYAELRGVPAGDPVTTLIEVRQLDRVNGRPLIRVSADGRSDGPSMAVQRQLDLRALRPGLYQLKVEVQTPGGTAGARTRTFEVVPGP